MTLQRRSYSTGHFELQIDGHQSTAYLKSVDGGFVKASPIDEPIGPSNKRIKHMSVIEVEPFSIEFGIARSNDVLKWVQSSWRKKFGRRNGSIAHANFDLQKTFEHEFIDALITEVSFPKLDTKAKDPAFIKMKIQPERVFPKKVPPGAKLEAPTGEKQKLWSPSAFRFNIDGIDEARYTTELEALTIKQGVKKMYIGGDRFPQVEPTKIDFPMLTGTIGLEYADKLLEWHDTYVAKGMQDPKAQKTGSIEFLSPDRQSTLFSINLYEMGIQHVAIQNSQGNQDAIKKCKFEIYCGRMDLDGSGALGMD